MKDRKGTKIGTVIKSLIMVFIVALSYVIIQDIGMIIIGTGIGENAEKIVTKNYFFIDTLLCTLMIGIYLPWYLLVRRKNRKLEIGTSCQEGRKPFPNSRIAGNVTGIVVISLGLGGLSFMWLVFADAFLKNAPIFGPSMASFNETWADTDQHPYLWVILSVAIIGPIIEEIIFRGIAYKYIERISTGYLPAILSGIAFGIWHMEPVQCVYASLMGIIMGIVYKKTRNLNYTIAIHIINNTLSTLPPAIDTDAVNGVINMLSLMMAAPALILTVFFIISMRKENKLNSYS